jgi:hypothetical protein
MAVGLDILVTDVNPSGYNTAAAKITGVTSNTVSYQLPTNPGAYVSGGTAQQIHEGLEIATFAKYDAQFKELDRLLAREHGVLFFMCCMTAQGADGSEFLKEVSKKLPGRDIMAIATIGFSHGAKQIRRGEGCNEPGMRDTAEIFPAPNQTLEEQRFDPIWNDLNVLPWASRESPHTKIARDGAIVGGRGRSL